MLLRRYRQKPQVEKPVKVEEPKVEKPKKSTKK